MSHRVSGTMISGLVLLVCLVGWISRAGAEPASTTRTISNLNTAIQGEANAAHRYTLFAKRADEEGHAQVAKLFRAAAAAEVIHRRNHEKVVHEMGLEPKQPVIDPVRVGTTRENLEVPVKGEANEKDEMYPAFVNEARQDTSRPRLRASRLRSRPKPSTPGCSATPWPSSATIRHRRTMWARSPATR